MLRKRPTLVALMIFVAWESRAHAQDAAYPRMAPIDQYLMAPDAETTLARSAAPKSISQKTFEHWSWGALLLVCNVCRDESKPLAVS
jgi:hypothetical protein